MPRLAPPKYFDTDNPANLRQNLEKLVVWLENYAREANHDYRQRLQIQPGITKSGDVDVRFGQAIQLAPLEDDTVDVFLPRPTVKDSWSECGVIRRTETGLVTVHATLGNINGDTEVNLVTAHGVTVFVCDGTDFWTQFPSA